VTISVEDLKHRFYSIQKTLLDIRNSSDTDMKKHPLYKNEYDGPYETERKEQLRRLYSRSQDEVDEMALIVLEHRRLSQAIKKLKKQTKGFTKSSPSTNGPKKIKEKNNSKSDELKQQFDAISFTLTFTPTHKYTFTSNANDAYVFKYQ